MPPWLKSIYACALLTLAAFAAAVGCSDAVDTVGTGGQAGPGGGGPGGGGSDAGPVLCTSRAMDHAAACPTEPCAITADVEIACDDQYFAERGPQVAPAPDATWLATSSYRERMVYRIAGGEAVRTEDGLPASYAGENLMLALGKDGTPHIATSTSTSASFPKPGSTELAVLKDGTWSTSFIYDFSWPIIDFEIGADGAPRVWVPGTAPAQFVIATPAADGTWTTTPAPTPTDGGGWRRFTLTADDRSAGFDFLVDMSLTEGQLRTTIDGAEASIGDPVVPAPHYPFDYVVTHAVAPASTTTEGPLLAVAIQHADGVHVAWPTSAGYDELVLSNSNIPSLVCDSMWTPGNCPGPCHETSAGIEPEAYAIARTADGAIWVAFVRTQFDTQIHSIESCPEPPYCTCEAMVDEDHTTATLHLVRIQTDQPAATEVLTVPIAPPQTFGYTDHNLFHLVDLRGFGTDLAVGVRTRTDVENAAAVRVLRIGTTKFAPPP